MESNEEKTRADHRQYQAFTAHLSSLKQQGSALLVVGNLPAAQYRQACHQMLGDSATASRRRILITAGETAASPTARLPAAYTTTPYTTTHIRYPLHSRQATSSTGSASPQLPTKSVDGPDLAGLEETIVQTIDEYQAGAGDLSPAELRVCFDSLRPVLSTHEETAVVDVLHRLVGHIREVQGMGHFHCPIAREHDSVHLLEDLFDGIVELRRMDGTIQQHWEFPDKDLESTWVDL